MKQGFFSSSKPGVDASGVEPAASARVVNLPRAVMTRHGASPTLAGSDAGTPVSAGSIAAGQAGVGAQEALRSQIEPHANAAATSGSLPNKVAFGADKDVGVGGERVTESAASSAAIPLRSGSDKDNATNLKSVEMNEAARAASNAERIIRSSVTVLRSFPEPIARPQEAASAPKGVARSREKNETSIDPTAANPRPSPMESIGNSKEARAMPSPLPLAPPKKPELPAVGASAPIMFPARRRKRKWFGLASFLILVVAPMALTSVYAFYLAADQYAAEYHFSIRGATSLVPAPPPTPGSTALSGLLSSLGGGVGGNDPLSSYAVIDYIQSPQAIADVAIVLPVRNYFVQSNGSWWERLTKDDIWAKLSPSASPEDFAKYWPRMVSGTFDPATGIASVQVKAFSAGDAFALVKVLEDNTEKIVNSIQNRALDDLVRFAKKEVDLDQKMVSDLDAEALALRQTTGVIDPTSSVVTQNNGVIQTLVLTLSQLQTQYSAAAAGIKDQNSPALASLRDSIAATQKQIADTKADVGASAKGAIMPATVGKFEDLTLRRGVAAQLLQSSVSLLQSARQNAVSQHLYVMTHVEALRPSTPDYPIRWQMLAIVLGACLGVWLIVSSMWNSFRNLMP